MFRSFCIIIYVFEPYAFAVFVDQYDAEAPTIYPAKFPSLCMSSFKALWGGM
jgi:hypothetical protein